MTQTANPLKQFFRQPVLYLKLPGDGQFWPDGSLDMPVTRELPVFPMTAIDEITYRTPDAMFNGVATVNVIQSCIPNIKDAWQMPGIDFNAILIAVRAASYGGDLEISSVCPKCNSNADYGLDLMAVLASLKLPDFSARVTRGDLEIYFKPMSYQQQNEINIKQFAHQRIIQGVQASDLPNDQKVQQLNAALKDITLLTMTAISNSIAGIKTTQSFVTDTVYIEEFLNNCDSKLYGEIRAVAVSQRQASELPPMDVTCSECTHKYTQEVMLDQTSFFDPAS